MTSFEELVLVVLSGVIIAISLLAFSTPDRLRRLGEINLTTCSGWRPLSPNWITVWGLLLTLFGFWVYLNVHPFIGFDIVVAGAMLDRIDGKMATAIGKTLELRLPLWNQMNFPGKTSLGEILDPLADKLRFLPMLTYAACQTNLVLPALAIAMWGLEIFSTCMRPPFHFLDPWVSGRGATGFGKLKVALQWITLILWAGFHQDWLPEGQEVVNVAMSLAFVFGTMSISSRLKFVRQNRRVAKVIREADQEFKHDERR